MKISNLLLVATFVFAMVANKAQAEFMNGGFANSGFSQPGFGSSGCGMGSSCGSGVRIGVLVGPIRVGVGVGMNNFGPNRCTSGCGMGVTQPFYGGMNYGFNGSHGGFGYPGYGQGYGYGQGFRPSYGGCGGCGKCYSRCSRNSGRCRHRHRCHRNNRRPFSLAIGIGGFNFGFRSF